MKRTECRSTMHNVSVRLSVDVQQHSSDVGILLSLQCNEYTPPSFERGLDQMRT